MTDLSYIAPPVDRELIKKELKQKHFLRKSNFGNKEIYVTTAHLSPNVMQEIGRLRELSFASDGGGTGKPVDIDEYDTMDDPYCCKQLFVWAPEDEEIVGAYRFIHGCNMMRREDGSIVTPTADQYQFSQEFINNYLPYTIELGRAFVQPAYQPGTNLRKGLYSLDNLWDGLGSIALEVPETRYFFGKITMYADLDQAARDAILYFYQKHFPDRDGLVWPYEPISIQTDFNELVHLFNGRNYKEDYQILLRTVRAHGSTVPPLINAYMNLSSTMRSFGTCPNHHLAGTTDTGILITLNDLFPEKRSRYLESYEVRNQKLDRRRLFHINMKLLPWWKNTTPDEMSSLTELKEMKSRKSARKALRNKSKELRKELKQELKSIKRVRRKLKKSPKE
ncbi:MAG: GNAT family N-acetyltransferase [Bacteroidales bacterium]|nr:GNAT family N-acetyltransferase [Bacteroidales bacterium]